MKEIRNEEEAVSPVIGVILMVAIVVILAAVIAAFVFGMAGSAGTSKNVGLTVTMNGTQGLDLLWQGGTDINSLEMVNASTTNGASGQISGTMTNFGVGNITKITFSNSLTGERVIITGTFTDGSTQVLFDRRY